MRTRIIGAITVLTLIAVLIPARIRAQQGGTTRFVYDDNGRLTAVISPNGEAAVYDYDPAGNFTAIRRISADTLTLLAFLPHQGGAGDEVTFAGTGFNAGATSVSFNGTSAQITSVTPSAVVAVVPDTATTGPVTIVTPRGTLITPVPFTVTSRVRVLPSNAILFPGDSFPFTAITGAGGDQSVIWTVNGIVGGNTLAGAISVAGVYIAPANLAGNASLSVIVRAASAAQPSLFGEARVTVLNPNGLGSLFAPAVSLRKGDPLGMAAARAPMVSVRRGVAISGPLSFLTPPVSVSFGATGSRIATVFSPFVSATTGPAISSISPASITHGTTVTLNISGANLAGASVIRFINSSGAIDTTIAPTNLTVNADGTQLTATVTVSSVAATGTRVVVVTASAGTTLAVGAGPNTIAIQ